MLKKQRTRFLIGLFVVLSLWLLRPTTTVYAAVCSSTGSGSWATPGTWSGCGGGIPQNNDDVIINAGHVVTVNGNSNNLASLTVNGTLNIGNDNTARTVTVSGPVTINSGGTLQVPGSSNTTHSLLIGGNLLNEGSFNARTDGDSYITVTFNGTSNQLVSGSGVVYQFNMVTLNNTGAAGNNILEVTAPQFSPPKVGFLTLTSGIIKFSGIYTLSNVLFAAAPPITINSNSGVWLNNPSVAIGVEAAGALTLNGSLQITQGVYNAGFVANDHLRYGNGATLIIEGGVLRVAGFLRPDSVTNALNFTMSGGELLLSTATSDSSATDSGSFDISAAASSFSMSGGQIIIQRENGSALGFDYRNVAGTTNVTGGTVQFGTNLSPAGETYLIGQAAGPTSVLPSVVLHGPNPPVVTLQTAAIIQGSLTINSGTTFNANGHAITISGDWTNDGSFSSGTQTTTFAGATPQTLSGSSVTGFSTLTINNGATVIIPATNIPTAAAAVNNNGTLQQTRPVNGANVSFLTISTDRYRGVDIDTTGSAANLGDVTVSIRGNSGLTCPNTAGPSPIYAHRCFDITPTNQGAAVVTLWVTTAEHTMIPTVSELAPYRFNAGTWEQLPGIVTGSGSNNYAFAIGNTSGFSEFLVGSVFFTPTAVTLGQMGVATGNSLLWVGAAAFLLLITAFWLRRAVESKP
ncbi:MAG: hypothetical protein KJ063_06370 [Anaerolineae bacterium]|nr:hypothetical protein [Anaerolineae bacterium]